MGYSTGYKCRWICFHTFNRNLMRWWLKSIIWFFFNRILLIYKSYMNPIGSFVEKKSSTRYSTETVHRSWFKPKFRLSSCWCWCIKRTMQYNVCRIKTIFRARNFCIVRVCEDFWQYQTVSGVSFIQPTYTLPIRKQLISQTTQITWDFFLSAKRMFFSIW